MNAERLIKKMSFAPPSLEILDLERKTAAFVDILKRELKHGDIFVGGSFGKRTMVNKEVHDVDIFVRMPEAHFDIKAVEKAAKKAATLSSYTITQVQGSRPYFRIGADRRTIFEVVPALKISKPKDAENVIDLSYFHVAYVKKQLKKSKRLAEEIRAAKAFCMAAGVYGAESYIRGFSGYAIECLIISYKKLINALNAIVKTRDKIVLDPAHHYKNSQDALYSMNESKTSGPIVIVDPTWAERNVCAAVSNEAFEALRKYARVFLKKPRTEFFRKKEFSPEQFSAQAGKGAEYVLISMQTGKQEGDIAGTKLKKYANYLISELADKLDIKKSRFEYGGGKNAELHILARPKKEIIIDGPPLNMENHAARFRKEHRAAFVKDGKLYARERITDSVHDIISKCIGKNKQKAKDMAVTSVSVRSN